MTKKLSIDIINLNLSKVQNQKENQTYFKQNQNSKESIWGFVVENQKTKGRWQVPPSFVQVRLDVHAVVFLNPSGLKELLHFGVARSVPIMNHSPVGGRKSLFELLVDFRDNLRGEDGVHGDIDASLVAVLEGTKEDYLIASFEADPNKLEASNHGIRREIVAVCHNEHPLLQKCNFLIGLYIYIL